MSSEHASLDAATTERKARLAKLASLKRKQSRTEEDDIPAQRQTASVDSIDDHDTQKYLSGRNYDAESRGPKLGFENAPIDGKDTLELRAKGISDASRNKEENEKKEEKPLDLFALQPKKPNWDLKRDLAQKLDILEQRTDNAIARIVRERIEGQKLKDASKLNGKADGMDGENMGMSGVDLVEGVRLREKEEADEEKREQEIQEG